MVAPPPRCHRPRRVERPVVRGPPRRRPARGGRGGPPPQRAGPAARRDPLGPPRHPPGHARGAGRLHRELADGTLWVGIDSWGVDYGLLDADGRLLGPPFHYRDDRTAGRLEELDRVVGLGPLYDATGTQAMAFNTVGQLLAERASAAYAAASHLLMVPDLLAYLLTGQRRLERTIASTTQLVDARTGEFVEWLFPRLGLRRDLLERRSSRVSPTARFSPPSPPASG